MPILPELAAQIAYQRRLARQLGSIQALRFRAAKLGARAGLRRSPTIAIHPAGLIHPVCLRLASTDAEVFGQVITNQEYAPAILRDARIIVDCGANIGLTSAYFLSRLPQARVIAIEPFPANAELCRRNLAPYGERARIIEAAIWNTCTTLALDATEGAEWAVQVRDTGGAGTVRAIDIPSLALPGIDILKVDIEGAEAILFDETAALWLPLVRNIAIELHGAACEQRFRNALAGYRFSEGRSGDLTLCLGLEQKRNSSFSEEKAAKRLLFPAPPPR
jgi:FkbM family methyltransferase